MYARRSFVAVWILLGLLGALNHTIALQACNRRFDLQLPHLRYGHVMFNKNPRTVFVFEYARRDGVRHDLAELVARPALGYKRARVAMNLRLYPDYLEEICANHANKAPTDTIAIIISEYDLDKERDLPVRRSVLRCDSHGLRPF